MASVLCNLDLWESPLLWAANHRQSKHLLLQPVLAERPPVPSPWLPLQVPSFGFPGAGGPEASRGSRPGSAPAFLSRGGARPRCPTTHPGPAFFASSGRAGVLGPRQGPCLEPPGLCDQKSESRRRTPSAPVYHPGATSTPQCRVPAEPPLPVYCAPPFPA